MEIAVMENSGVDTSDAQLGCPFADQIWFGAGLEPVSSVRDKH